MPQSSSKTLAPPPADAGGFEARPSKGAMSRTLPDELLEEVLFRLPPHEPAELVRAALVSRRWCRLVSDPGFRRRFREFHRRPPLLGMLWNQIRTSRFIPTTAFCTPRIDFRDMHALDARHGRVLCERGRSVLAVWDPITNVVRELPFLEKSRVRWTATVLCSAAGACDHLDCHHGPFLVVFVCSQDKRTYVYTYSSDAAAWSEPVCAPQNYLANFCTGNVLVGNALYFGNLTGKTALKYDLEFCQASWIQLPSSLSLRSLWYSLLTTTEDGGLGLLNKDDSKLYMWSRKDTHEVDAIWERRVIIELKTVFPADVDITKLYVIGSDVGIIFTRTRDEVYTIDLKTYEVKKIYEGKADRAIPYMSFYTPAFDAACLGEEPSAGG